MIDWRNGGGGFSPLFMFSLFFILLHSPAEE